MQIPNQQGWNPDQACEEMAALFAQTDRIMQQPHYKASAEELDSPSAGSSQTIALNERKELTNHGRSTSTNAESTGVNDFLKPASDNAAHP